MSKNSEENISSATNSETLPTTADREPPQSLQHQSMTYGPPQPLAPQPLSVLTYHPRQLPLQLMTNMIPPTSQIPMAPDSVYMQMPLYRNPPPHTYQMQMPQYRNKSSDMDQTASAMPPFRNAPPLTYQTASAIPPYQNPPPHTYQMQMPTYRNPPPHMYQMQMPPCRNPWSDMYQTASAMPPYQNQPPHTFQMRMPCRSSSLDTYQMRMPYRSSSLDTYQMQLQPRYCVQPIRTWEPMRPGALQVQLSHRLEDMETHVANMHQDVSFVQDEESYVPYYCSDCFTVMYSRDSVEPNAPLEIRRQPTLVCVKRMLVSGFLDNEFYNDRHDDGDADNRSDDFDPEFAASNPGPRAP